jgi:type I restriction enzyme R subunit
MPTNIREIGFEEYIEQKLVDLGYRKRLDSQYRKDFAMDGELVMEFIRATQPKELEKLSSQHGEATGEQVLARIDQEIADRGLLDVLRKGISDHGVRLQLAYYAPESGLNPEIGALYDNNILSATRQVHYSDQNGNSIDMVLFLNGLPIWTIELKNQLSGQTVADGIRQYKTDRDPKERLLGFKRCLAHWAVDAEQAWVSTRLAGLKTRFLPFNKGWQDGAGNPPNPNGYKTEYVWADTWTRDSVLDLVGRFLHLQIEEAEDENGRKTRKETLIFPRYHQLDAVRRLIAHAKAAGEVPARTTQAALSAHGAVRQHLDGDDAAHGQRGDARGVQRHALRQMGPGQADPGVDASGAVGHGAGYSSGGRGDD